LEPRFGRHYTTSTQTNRGHRSSRQGPGPSTTRLKGYACAHLVGPSIRRQQQFTPGRRNFSLISIRLDWLAHQRPGPCRPAARRDGQPVVFRPHPVTGPQGATPRALTWSAIRGRRRQTSHQGSQQHVKPDADHAADSARPRDSAGRTGMDQPTNVITNLISPARAAR